MKIVTNIAREYVPTWGIKEGIRELVQNSLDANDKGFKSQIFHHKDAITLYISNENVQLEHKSLLLGGGTKVEDNSQRGKHSEGMKIGILALLRQGKEVSLHNGESHERWDFYFEDHEDLKEKVLVFKINPGGSKFKSPRLIVEVKNFTAREFTEIKQQFLVYLDIAKDSKLKTPQGDVLLEKRFKGKIFCGGIYVSEDPDLTFGYDFKPSSLKLNRDRDMVGSFDLYWSTSQVWAMLSQKEKGYIFNATTLVKEGAADVKYFHEFSKYEVKDMIAKTFLEENGDRAFPVTSDNEAREVRSLGYIPFYSSQSYAKNLEPSLGTLEGLKKRLSVTWEIFHNLRPSDDANITWAMETFHKVFNDFSYEIEIVKFRIDSTRALFENGKIILNHNIIHDKYEILSQIIIKYSNKTDNSKPLNAIWKEIYRKCDEGLIVKN